MPESTRSDVSRRLEAALSFAEEAGKLTLQHFRRPGLQVVRKGDGSPVTAADRAAESLLRERIQERFPTDAILGEEFGETAGDSGYRWVLDPIDGTKSFIHGVPLYTTLVAVMDHRNSEGEGTPLIGVIHSPATRETVSAAVLQGCWLKEGDAAPRPASVSPVRSLEESLFLTTDSAGFEQRASRDRDLYRNLQQQCRLSRTWGDAYGYLMVATGRAEVMIDAELSLWDAAALQPIIEEAGGTFCDWQGRATVHSGEAIATNGQVTDAVLAVTRGR